MNTVLLASYFFTAMTAATPLEQHANYEPVETTRARYADLALTIAEGVQAEDMPDLERLKICTTMVMIADAESHQRADVVTCAKGGDGDKAWGPWQTQRPKEQVCASLPAAFRIALGMVKQSLKECRALPAKDRLSWYTDGGSWNLTPANRARAAKRSQWRLGRALDYVAKHPFEIDEDT